MKINQTILAIAALAILTYAAFPCGAPQPIHGRAFTFIGYPIFRARVELRDAETGEPLYATMTNGFGYYSFPPVLPCSDYWVLIEHKRYVFFPAEVLVTSKQFPNDDPAGVTVNFWAGTLKFQPEGGE